MNSTRTWSRFLLGLLMGALLAFLLRAHWIAVSRDAEESRIRKEIRALNRSVSEKRCLSGEALIQRLSEHFDRIEGYLTNYSFLTGMEDAVVVCERSSGRIVSVVYRTENDPAGQCFWIANNIFTLQSSFAISREVEP